MNLLIKSVELAPPFVADVAADQYECINFLQPLLQRCLLVLRRLSAQSIETTTHGQVVTGFGIAVAIIVALASRGQNTLQPRGGLSPAPDDTAVAARGALLTGAVDRRQIFLGIVFPPCLQQRGCFKLRVERPRDHLQDRPHQLKGGVKSSLAFETIDQSQFDSRLTIAGDKRIIGFVAF